MYTQGSKYFILYGGFGNQAFQINRALYERKRDQASKFYLIDLINDSPMSDLFNKSYFQEKGLHYRRGGKKYRYIFAILIKALFRVPFPGVVRDKSKKGRTGWLYCGYWQDDIYGFDTSLLKGRYEGRSQVVVHVRGGDYNTRKNSQIFHTLEISYYRKALEELERRGVPLEMAQIVTNDLSYAQKIASELTNNFPLLKVAISKGRSSAEDFMILASANCLVGANSTFSLVASFYGNKQNVIFPRRWFRKNVFRGYPRNVFLVE